MRNPMMFTIIIFLATTACQSLLTLPPNNYLISQHKIVPDSEYEPAWSRAHSYCTRYSLPYISINNYTMKINNSILLTREKYNNNTVIRYTTIIGYDRDVIGTPWRESFKKVRDKVHSLNTFFNYVAIGSSPLIHDLPIPKDFQTTSSKL
jgi:hypothetical protein